MKDRRSNKNLASEKLDSAGPYEALIVSHLDPYYGGGLEVELLKSSSAGNSPEKSGQIVTVKYLSPFYGVTPLAGSGKKDQYNATQKSYGFWAVPPDIGTKVLVIFAEGKLNQGFWIGCVQDTHMNFMVPDGRATTGYNTVGDKLPVGEFNKLLETRGDHPTAFNKPINVDYANRMFNQGLDKDETRGLSSTSARRGAISNVYGWNTPGPLDKRPSAPKVRYGDKDHKATIPVNRLGGSSFVMDDGDETQLRRGPAKDTPMEYTNQRAGESGGDKTLPANELTRIRTRTGHQILLHNTEDLIYISHGSGDSWIELTANGKIDIYAKDSISIHSSQDLNFTADRDINFTAIRDLNTVVGRNHNESAGDQRNIKTGTHTAFSAGTSFNANAQSTVSLYSEASTTILAQDEMTMQSSGNLFLGTTSNMNIDACAGLKITTDGDNHIKAVGNLIVNSDAAIDVKSATNTKLSSGEQTDIHAGTAALVTAAGGGLDLNASSNITQTGAEIHLNGPVAATAAIAADAEVSDAANPVVPVAPTQALQTTRRPNHEPWYEHENYNPTAYTPEKTEAGQASTDSYAPERPDTFLRNSNVTGTNAPTGTAANTFGTVAPNGSIAASNTPGGVTSSPTLGGTQIPTGTPEEISDKKERARIFANSLRTIAGFNDEFVKAAIVCANTESKISATEESSYGGTSNDRIRSIFSAARTVSDSQLTSIKADKFQFFELVYGYQSRIGPGMGNDAAGDGGNYIGRGLIQLTGKGNYERYGKLAGLTNAPITDDNPFGVDIIVDPGLLLTDFKLSCDVCAAYLKDRYKDKGRGILGNMRLCIAGTEGGYNLGISKDRQFAGVVDADDTWYNASTNNRGFG